MRKVPRIPTYASIEIQVEKVDLLGLTRVDLGMLPEHFPAPRRSRFRCSNADERRPPRL
jgi:hypothetical protein